MKSPKQLNKTWNRTNLFYSIRHKLLSKKVTKDSINNLDYNQSNPPEDIPQIYYSYNAKIFKDINQNLSDFEKAITIAQWLKTNCKGGCGLGLDSSSTLKFMVEEKCGVCSDYSQVFNNFCVINNIKVREWGLNNKTDPNKGHSFNEVYCNILNKWILIDVSKGMFFKNTNLPPLSTIESFTHTIESLQKRTVYFLLPNDKTLEAVSHLYYTSDMEPFYIDKYKNKFYDTLLRNFYKVPRPITHGAAILIGKSYKFKSIIFN